MKERASYDPDKHHRRSIRLKGWDYTRTGAYFVTICTRDRELLFEDPALADAVQGTWHELPDRFPAIALDAFVLMPNHVHCIVWLNPVGASFNDAPTNDAPVNDRIGFRRPQWDKQTPALGEIVRTFKALVTRHIHQVHPETPFAWQRNYHERIIRNERELNAIRRYIRDNPDHWAEDVENPARLG